jgi:hypothetical protein
MQQELSMPTASRDHLFWLLIHEQKHEDALCLLARWLPKRVAVWWGCLCNQLTAPEILPEAGREALQAALRWVVEPSEANRNAAMKAGQAEECQTPPGLLAMAAAWSGGSLGAPTMPVVIPPADHLTGQLVGCALLKAASQKRPMEYPENYRRFLGLGIELARGRNLWTPSGSISREELEGRSQESGVRSEDEAPGIPELSLLDDVNA